MSKLTKKRIIKRIAITIISIIIILFITLIIQLIILRENVSTEWHEQAEKEINKAIENMPIEQKLFYDSIKKLQSYDSDTIEGTIDTTHANISNR